MQKKFDKIQHPFVKIHKAGYRKNIPQRNEGHM